VHVRHQVPLAPLTTLGIGGSADTLVEYDDPESFLDVVRLVHQNGGQQVALGGGSNVVVADTGCPQPVIHVTTRGITLREVPDGVGVLVTAEAGHPFQDLVETTVAECLTGLETLVGIPGTVGATPVQNVGAYGQEVGDTLVEVDAWDWQENRAVTLDAAACRLGHRTSVFKHTARWTLLRVTFRLIRSKLSRPIDYRAVADHLAVAPGTRVLLGDAAQAVLAVRRSKGMVLDLADPDNRSAGSVFLSPQIGPARAADLRARQIPVHDFPDGSTRVSSSWLIKDAGFTLGQHLAPGIRISSKQYTLVADGPATSAAFAQAAEVIATQVQRETGVLLRPELDLLGSEPTYERLQGR
jgi:UDP-N-acetylmuramate dehydrogenase